MSKQKNILSKEIIDKKKGDLENKINASIEAKKIGRLSPAKVFLNEVKDLIKTGIDNNVSYKQLTKDIFDVYSFKVSEQTLRAFCKNVLEISSQKKEKKEVKKVTEEVAKKDDNVSKETTNNTDVKTNREKATW